MLLRNTIQKPRRATVRGAFDLLLIDGRRIPRADVPNVPVLWMDSGGYRHSNPLHEGDSVLLVFSMRCLEDWKETHDIASPMNDNIFSEGDAFVIPGFGAVQEYEPVGEGSVWQSNDGERYISINKENIEIHTKSEVRVVDTLRLVSPNQEYTHDIGVTDTGTLYGLSDEQGGGIRLGPEPSMFTSVSDRDNYYAAADVNGNSLHPAWRNAYDGDSGNLLRVVTSSDIAYYYRFNGNWLQYTPVLAVKGDKGDKGDKGEKGDRGEQGEIGIAGEGEHCLCVCV